MRLRSTTLHPGPPELSPPPAGSNRSADHWIPDERQARSYPGWEEIRAYAGRLWHAQDFDVVLLGMVVIAIIALNQLWVSIETRPPTWDMGRHLGDSLIYFGTFSFSHPLAPLQTYLWYPPFVYWIADAFYAVLGKGIWVAVLSQSVFLAILTFSTYGIGRRLWNRRVGLLAAIFVVTTPVMVSTFKQYMLDAPLTAMVALALYLLIRSENFSRLGPSLLFGAACGCGLLTKWTFPIPLVLPVGFCVVVATGRAVTTRSLRPVAGIAAAAALAFLICGVWYVHNWTQLSHDLSVNNGAAGQIRGAPPVASLASLGWYFWVLLKNQLYVIPFALLVIGLAFAFLRDDAARRNLLPILLILSTYIGFTLLRNKDVRFTFPILSGVAVVATSWTEYLRRPTKHLLTGLIATYGAVVFLAVSFGTSLLPVDASVGTTENGRPGITFFAQHGYGIGPPTSERWYQAEVFKQIADNARPSPQSPGPAPTFWFTGPDSEWFNTWDTRYYSLKYHETWVASPAQANFLVIRGPDNPTIPPNFVLLSRHPLPDDEFLSLYKRTA